MDARRYREYLSTMPWPAVPYDQQAAKGALEKAVGVSGRVKEGSG